jgi:tetratricopeptide (TPR) repeat protein
MQKKLLGEEHEEVAASLNNLAGALRENEKPVEAETMYREALAMQRRLLGEQHPAVAGSLNNLARMFSNQGRLTEAETMHREALATQRKRLGNEHADVAESLNRLADVLRSESKFAEAETTYREALAMQKKLWGGEHMEISGSLNNLALVLKAQGKLVEAETMFREALAISQKLEPNDPFVAIQLGNLAAMLQARGDSAGAEPLHRRALAVRQKLYGDTHPEVNESLRGLAVALVKQGKTNEAGVVFRKLTGSGITAMVNTKFIYHQELRSALREAETLLRNAYLTNNPALYREKASALRQETVERFIDQTLMVDEFDRTAPEATRTAVEREAKAEEDTLIARKYFGDTNLFLRTLAASRSTPERFREFRRQGRILAWMNSEKQKRLVQPTPEQIEGYYQTNQQQFKLDDQLKLRLIELKCAATGGVAKVRERALAIKTKIDGGAPFAEMATAHSEGSQREDGGLCGWMQENALKKGLWEVASTLATGQCSRVISLSSASDGTYWVHHYGPSGDLQVGRKFTDRARETFLEEKRFETGAVPGEPSPSPQAFFLMQVDAKQAARTRALNEVQDEIRQTLEREQRKTMEIQWRERLRRGAVIFLNPNEPEDLK